MLKAEKSEQRRLVTVKAHGSGSPLEHLWGRREEVGCVSGVLAFPND